MFLFITGNKGRVNKLKMQEKVDHIVNLVSKYLNDALSPEEKEALEQWLSENEANKSFLQQFSDDHLMMEEMALYAQMDAPDMWSKARQSLPPEVPLPRVRSFFLKKYLVGAVAAIVLLIGGYYLFVKPEKKTSPVVVKDKKQPAPTIDRSKKASLTLTDGTIVTLQDAKDGFLMQQGILKVSKFNNDLKYEITDAAPTGEILYNTITTIPGERYRVELPDGSKVWLNATSSLRFAVSSKDRLRHVEATGESYYEITKNPRKPFTVSIFSSVDDRSGTEVEVLGTHFNVNAYPEEGVKEITLVEGSIKVTAKEAVAGKKHSQVLKPHEQLQLNQQGAMKHINKVDVESIVAWKEGKLVFNNTPTSITLRRLARWYGYVVDTPGKLPDCVHSGRIDSTTNMEDVIRVMQAECKGLRITCNKEEKKITVLP